MPQVATPSVGVRLLLGLATALIVARPIVPGDDPGMLSPLSHPAGMAIGLAWLLALVGWAAWRSWKSDGTWITSGGIDVALLALFGVFLLSTFAAADYHQPAWLIAWEWLGYAVVFFLVRQLARTPEDNHALLCALIACAACIAVQALYQRIFELPAERAALESNRDEILQSFPRQYSFVETEDAIQRTRIRAIENGWPAGTFVDPENMAAFLAMLLPATLGLTLVAVRDPATRGRALALDICVLAMLAALVCAESRSALVALLFVGIAVSWRIYMQKGRRRLLVVGCVVAVAAVIGWYFATRHEVAYRVPLWRAAWNATERSPWIGVGAGNFGRHLAAFLVGEHGLLGYEESPRNFVLEIFSNAGVLGVIVLVAVTAVTVRYIRRASKEKQEEPSPLSPLRVQRWEFVLGGIVGLLAAFLMRVANLSQQQILHEAWMCGLRAMVWIAVFALCFATGSSPRLLKICCLAGVGAALLHLTVAGSLSNPAVGQPLLVMTALALNAAAPYQTSRNGRGVLAVHLPLPVSLTVLFLYCSLLFVPLISSAVYVARARRYYDAWQNTVSPDLRNSATGTLEGDPDKMRAAAGFVNRILVLLKDAGRANPGDAYLTCETAHWLSVRVELSEGSPHSDPGKTYYHQAVDATGSPLGSKHAADGAQRLDPRGMEGYLAEFRVHAATAVRLEKSALSLDDRAHSLHNDFDKAPPGKEKDELKQRATNMDAAAEAEHKLAERELDFGKAALRRMLEFHPDEGDRADTLEAEARERLHKVRTGKEP